MVLVVPDYMEIIIFKQCLVYFYEQVMFIQ